MFHSQFNTDIIALDVLYWVATMGTVLAVVGLAFVDFGVVRRKNALDTLVQKLVAALIAAGAFALIGNGVWNWQFNEAFGVPNPLGQSLQDWWIGGQYFNTFATSIDPKVVVEADVQQVFVAFFMSFAMIVVALIHSAGIERMRPLAMYVLAAVAGGLVIPILLYLTWGPVGPLTNKGVHDFVGIFPGYIFAGGWALIIAWRLGPRIGAFAADSRAEGPEPQNLGMTAMGVGLLLVAIPLFVLGCGYAFPGQGYFGINMTSSGFGIVFLNCFAALGGGALTGALLAYRTRNAFWALLGPVAGYISCAALLDFAKPWEVVLVALAGPFVAFGVDRLMYAIKVDEHKIVPLGLGCGAFGAIVAGFVGWGVKMGGFPGLEGTYAFQHAEINPGWQLIGLGVTLGVTFLSGLLLVLMLEKTIGIRVKENEEVEGLDPTYWPPEADTEVFGFPAEPVESMRS